MSETTKLMLCKFDGNALKAGKEFTTLDMVSLVERITCSTIRTVSRAEKGLGKEYSSKEDMYEQLIEKAARTAKECFHKRSSGGHELLTAPSVLAHNLAKELEQEGK